MPRGVVAVWCSKAGQFLGGWFVPILSRQMAVFGFASSAPPTIAPQLFMGDHDSKWAQEFQNPGPLIMGAVGGSGASGVLSEVLMMLKMKMVKPLLFCSTKSFIFSAIRFIISISDISPIF